MRLYHRVSLYFDTIPKNEKNNPIFKVYLVAVLEPSVISHDLISRRSLPSFNEIVDIQMSIFKDVCVRLKAEVQS